MVGEVKFSNTNMVKYVYVGEGNNWHLRNGVLRPFYEILTYAGFDCTVFKAQNRLRVNDTDQIFTFTNANNISYHLRGSRFERSFVDVTPETEHNFHQELNMLRYQTNN
jgi:hypothetical protein